MEDLNKFLEEKITDDLSTLHSRSLIKHLFLELNTGLPSSAAVERLLSLGGRVLTPTRTLLSDEHFEMLVFLKANGNIVKKNV